MARPRPTALILIFCSQLLIGHVSTGQSSFATERIADVPETELEEVRRIHDPLFGSIIDVRTDSRGHVYVADGQTRQIYELTPHGDFIRQFGGEGQGPGEFSHFYRFEMLPGDTLFIFDSSQLRSTWWPVGEDEPARVESVEVAFGTRYLLPRENGFVAWYEFWRFNEDDKKPRNILRLVDKQGAIVEDSVHVFPGQESLIVWRGGVRTVASSPLLYRNYYRANEQHIFRAWSGEPALEVYDRDLRLLNKIWLPHRRARVTDEDLRRVEGLFSGSGRESQALRQAAHDTAPDYWPSIRGIVLDESGCAWVGLRGREGDPVVWLQVTPEGEFLQRVVLPWNARLRAVHGKRFYSEVMDAQSGGPILVAYRILED